MLLVVEKRKQSMRGKREVRDSSPYHELNGFPSSLGLKVRATYRMYKSFEARWYSTVVLFEKYSFDAIRRFA